MRPWIGGLLVAVVLGASTGTAQERVLVLEGGTLIDGTGRAPWPTPWSSSRAARIKAVGTRGQVSYPSNANVIRLNGRTILPGLIDGHVHLREYQLPMFLPYGVTTIADIHNDTAWSIAQREALKSGRIKGPRMFVSGARVTGPGGPPTTDGSYVKDGRRGARLRAQPEGGRRRSHQGRPDDHRRSAARRDRRSERRRTARCSGTRRTSRRPSTWA